jgi:hypothetical protein
MNRSLLVRLMLVTLLFSWSSATAANSAPEAEYESLLALSRRQIPLELRSGRNEEEKIAWVLKQRTELHQRGAAFLQQHADHPLRWDVLVLLRYGGEQRVKVSRSGFRQLLPVPESKAAWDRDYFARLEDLLAATDASPSARQQALQQLIDHTAREAVGTPTNQPEAIRRVLAWLEQYEREFPRANIVVSLYHTVANLLDAAAPDRCVAFLADLERRYRRGEYLDQRVQELVAGHRRALEAQALPLDELWRQLRTFDPVHGDVERYRGKVVLLAFGPVTYATFMESLEDLHAQYASQGLVIVQVVSFSRSVGLPPEPEQRRDLDKVLAARKWPWPFMWNPHGHIQLVQQWGINTVPARMLIGRDGVLVQDRNTPLSVSIPRELAQPAERN